MKNKTYVCNKLLYKFLFVSDKFGLQCSGLISIGFIKREGHSFLIFEPRFWCHVLNWRDMFLSSSASFYPGVSMERKARLLCSLSSIGVCLKPYLLTSDKANSRRED